MLHIIWIPRGQQLILKHFTGCWAQWRCPAGAFSFPKGQWSGLVGLVMSVLASNFPSKLMSTMQLSLWNTVKKVKKMGTMRPFSSCTDSYGNVAAKTNFMCQFDLVMGFPEICSSISLAMSVSVFFGCY